MRLKRKQILYIIVLSFITCTVTSGLTQELTTESLNNTFPSRTDQVFRIGFLTADVEPLLDHSLIQRLEHFIEQDQSIINDLRSEGKQSIAVIPVDGLFAFSSEVIND